MDIFVDCETQGLDATKFILGCIIKDNTKKPEIYYKKEDMWQRILELGEKEAKRGRILNVYAFNHTFDFYAYADLKDPKIVWFSEHPFIVAYRNYINEGDRYRKEYIKFLDANAIYTKMNLKKMGNIIGLPKMETPEELLKEAEQKITPELIKKITPYCIRDTEIVKDGIKKIKKLLDEEGLTVKRLYTINQIAINHLMNNWKFI